MEEHKTDVWKLVLCVVGITFTWMAHDFIAEAVFHMEGFSFGWFMSFWLQVTTVIGASIQIGIGKLYSSWRGEGDDGKGAAGDSRKTEVEAGGFAAETSPPSLATRTAPLGYLFALAVCITLSNGFSSAALKHVNMPVKVLFKSSKLVPVILVRTLMGNASHQWSDYGVALLICVGLAAFSLADSQQSARFNAIGVLLLTLAVLSDSVTPNLQEKLLRGCGQEKSMVVFHSNWMSAALTLYIIVQTGELTKGLQFCGAYPKTLWLLLLQSVAGYLGILVYLQTVRLFGSQVTTIVTSTRKMLTICVSVLVFSAKQGDSFTIQHGAGVLLVMGAVTGNALLKNKG